MIDIISKLKPETIRKGCAMNFKNGNKKKQAGLFGADGKPLDEKRGPKTLYGLIIAAFRGDGGPGLIEQPHKLSRKEYYDFLSILDQAKNFQDMILKATDTRKQGDHFTLKTTMVLNQFSNRIAYLSFEEFHDDGKGVILTPADKEFYTPRMKLAKGFEGWNDPIQQ
jgi:hypothetical protein